MQHERIRLEKGVHFHYTDPAAVVIYTRLSREPEVALTENQHIDEVVKHAAANIRRGQKRGELPSSIDPELAGAAMFGAMQRVMVTALGREPRPRPDRIVEVLLAPNRRCRRDRPVRRNANAEKENAFSIG